MSNTILIATNLTRVDHNYAPMFESIRQIGATYRPLENLWIVETSQSAAEVYETLKGHFQFRDQLLVFLTIYWDGKNFPMLTNWMGAVH